MDDLIGSGTNILQGLRDQRVTLKVGASFFTKKTPHFSVFMMTRLSKINTWVCFSTLLWAENAGKGPNSILTKPEIFTFYHLTGTIFKLFLWLDGLAVFTCMVVSIWSAECYVLFPYGCFLFVCLGVFCSSEEWEVMASSQIDNWFRWTWLRAITKLV